MKTLCALLLCLVAMSAAAQTVCGPFSPSGRSQNPDGTWTVGTNSSCQIPDPTTWAHTYTLIFPSTITYTDGVTLQFVGSASAYVQGHHDRFGRAFRLVTVDSAVLTDPAGNNHPLTKIEVDISGYSVDEWMTTAPLAPDTLYGFSVSGTDPDYNKSEDTVFMHAVYQQVQSPLAPAPN